MSKMVRRTKKLKSKKYQHNICVRIFWHLRFYLHMSRNSGSQISKMAPSTKINQKMDFVLPEGQIKVFAKAQSPLQFLATAVQKP